MRILRLDQNTKTEVLSILQERSPNHDEKVNGIVRGILDEVKEAGDEAVFAGTGGTSDFYLYLWND